jgi:hypothetical protein
MITASVYCRSMQALEYRRRTGPLSRGERLWRIEDEALITRGPTGRERRYPWREIVSVRLYCEPTRGRPWRYVFELQPLHHKRIVLDNAHCVSRSTYEDRSESYTPFVRAALDQVARHNPKARALIGETQKRYFFMLLGSLVGLGALAIALSALPTPLDTLPFASWAKLILILVLAPIFLYWVLKAMPRGVPLDSIPERSLPPCGRLSA